MALAHSIHAIGAVTRLLVDHLIRRTGLNISAGHPRATGVSSDSTARINLFLYESAFDGHLKNHSLHESEAAPLWLVLKYVLTAYDSSGSSDSADAHDLVGQGMAALYEVNLLTLDASVTPGVLRALENNPEPLKLTFDETPPDLLSKLMQGPDETFRFSIGFQVRPVMIVAGELPSYSLLVGINYETAPPAIIGEEGVQLMTLPSLGPRIASVAPDSFQANANDAAAQIVSIGGEELHLANLECMLGPAVLPIVAQRTDEIRVRVGSGVAAGAVISAGEHPLVVRQLLANGRYRSSNLLSARLRPTVNSLAQAVTVNAGPPATVTGTLTFTGNLLGNDLDDVRIGFHRLNRIVRMIDVQAAAGDQTSLPVTLPTTNPIAAGPYRLIVVVNGQQATHSPRVDFV